MNTKSTIHQFLEYLEKAVQKERFVKLTLSKPASKSDALKNVYVRPLLLKGELCLSFTFRYEDRDETKNFNIKKGLAELYKLLGNVFLNGNLIGTEQSFLIRYNRKRQATLLAQKNTLTAKPELTHDKQKKRWVDPQNNIYLNRLGITNNKGEVLAKGQKKFKQINKYIEIVDGLLQNVEFPIEPRIVDMGCGKGYLTFALYDFLKNTKNLEPQITGIELREKLVKETNLIAKEMNATGLNFVAENIESFDVEELDLLIALHACDTATDLAIAKGIKSDAKIIIVAPCCHKQIRKQMNCQTGLKNVLTHGILKERQAELVTDGIRALMMSAHGYKTKVFEFISTEHTAKNIMIVGTKGKKDKAAIDKVEQIKQEFGIDFHFLEKLL